MQQGPFQAKKINETTLEVCLQKSHSLNDLFLNLDNLGIEVLRCQVKENPVESAFYHFTQGVS